MVEALDELVRVHHKLFEPVMQIEQVAVLAPLQQGSQLGAERLFRLERRDLASAPIPVAFHRKGVRPDGEPALVLAGVDFDLEFQRRLRIGLGRELEHQMHRMPGLLALALAQP